MRHVRHIMAAATLILFTMFLADCSGAGSSYCDSVCDCDGCSDREYDDCRSDYDYEADRADRRDCGPEWDDYAACVEDDYSCHRGHYGCDVEWDRYKHCVD